MNNHRAYASPPTFNSDDSLVLVFQVLYSYVIQEEQKDIKMFRRPCQQLSIEVDDGRHQSLRLDILWRLEISNVKAYWKRANISFQNISVSIFITYHRRYL